MEQTLSRRERKKLETRQALLEAAATLFHEKGFDETTVEEITEQADVAKGTFFNYFPSKEALLVEWAVWGVERLQAMLDVSQGAPASPVARLKLLMYHLHGRVADDMHFIQRAMATRLSTPPPPPHRARHQLHGLFVDLVAEAQACGEIRPGVDTELISDLIHTAFFRRMIACRDNDKKPPSTAHIDEIVNLLMDGLAGPNWRKE